MESRSAYMGQTQAPKIWAYYNSGDSTPLGGQPVCYDFTNSTAASRSTNVQRPTLNNMEHYAGYVVAGSFKPSDADANKGWVQIVPATENKLAGVKVLTDQNCAVGDLLAVVPGSNFFGRAVAQPAVFVCTEAVDRSGTPGLVTGEYYQQSWGDMDPTKVFRHFDHFTGGGKIAATVAAAVLTDQYVLRGTTAISTYLTAGTTPAAVGGGELMLTPTTTTIAQACTPGTPFLLAAGKSAFLRARVAVHVAADATALLGLAVGQAANIVADGNGTLATDLAATDLIGFLLDAGLDSGKWQAVARKASGTGVRTSLGAAAVADTYVDLAMMAINRATGTAIGTATAPGNKQILAWLNGTLVDAGATATILAQFPDTVPLSLAWASIDAAGNAPTICLDRLEACQNL